MTHPYDHLLHEDDHDALEATNARIVWSADKGWHDGPPAHVDLDDHGRLQVTAEGFDKLVRGALVRDWNEDHRDHEDHDRRDDHASEEDTR